MRVRTADQTGAMAVPEIDEKKCLDFLSRLIQIKSYSRTDGEIEASDFMAASMAELGIEAQTCPFDEGRRQNAVGVWKGTGGGGQTLLFNGHLDTNPVTEGWTVDPWAGLVDEDFVYGIGVSNMKAGCAAYFCAVAELRASGWRPRGDVVLTYVVGELQGGVGTVALIEQGRMAGADYFVNCEPSDIRAITMHAAAAKFRIDLIGVTRHMSAREEAADAIAAATELVPRLNALTFRGARTPEHRLCNRCHVGVLHGALGRDLVEWRPPQVADVCVLQGSVRYAPGQTPDHVRADLHETVAAVVARYPGMHYELNLRTESSMPAFEVPADSRIVKAVNKAYQDVRGQPQPTGVLKPTCFYGTDGGHIFERLGMQGIVCGPGGRYNTRPDEKVDIPDYLDCIRMFMRLIVDICG